MVSAAPSSEDVAMVVFDESVPVPGEPDIHTDVVMSISNASLPFDVDPDVDMDPLPPCVFFFELSAL